MLLARAEVAALLAVALLHWHQVEGHGRLRHPPGRGTAWRLGFATPPNYDDHGTNCGGYAVQHNQYSGYCGVCGDPYGGPLKHEPGPDNVYATGTIVSNYVRGQKVIVDVEVTVSHRGYYEFNLCQNDVPQTGTNRQIALTQSCFDRILLQSPEGKIRFDEGQKNIVLQLPENLVCSACVLQWRWKVGNSWDCDQQGCGLGHGKQEEFRACADIAIAAGGNSPESAYGARRLVTKDRPPNVRTDSDGSGVQSTKTRAASCKGVPPWNAAYDSWCDANCNHTPSFCPKTHCKCTK